MAPAGLFMAVQRIQRLEADIYFCVGFRILIYSPLEIPLAAAPNGRSFSFPTTSENFRLHVARLLCYDQSGKRSDPSF